MTPTNQRERSTVLRGDCLEVLRTLPSESVDSVVTDPPAGISFMGKEWDDDKGGRDAWVAWLESVMREALRTLKPGGHALVWAIPRTSHWTATAIENAGFEVRDVITHHFGTGFPKSLDVSKAIDKAAGAERSKVRVPADEVRNPKSIGNGHGVDGGDRPWMKRALEVGYHEKDSDEPATDAAKLWSGWGTALKPASEHWILARKPLSGTVAANVQRYGTGALNIDGARVGTEGATKRSHQTDRLTSTGVGWTTGHDVVKLDMGRWPANLVLSAPVDEAFGEYARFFYVAKPSKAERDAGLDGFEARVVEAWEGARINNADVVSSDGVQRSGVRPPRANVHPTVKPIELMRYLARLVTPPGGTVLDPFVGSGTTGCAAALEGFRFIGIEQSDEYAKIAEARIAHWAQQAPSSLDRFKALLGGAA